jgi:hypothetical protein
VGPVTYKSPQVIGGHGRFECGENKNFAVRTDFEYCTAAIANVEAAGLVERQAGSDAHAFHPLHRATVGRDAMDSAIVAAGNEKKSIAVERETRGVHHLGDERLDGLIRGDFVKRDGNFLTALAAKGHVGVAVGVNRRAGDGMEVVGNLRAERERERRAFDTAHFHAYGASLGSFRNTRDQVIISRQDERAFRNAKLHQRARVVARAEAAAVNGDLATWQSGCGLHAFDSGDSVHGHVHARMRDVLGSVIACTKIGLVSFVARLPHRKPNQWAAMQAVLQAYCVCGLLNKTNRRVALPR